MLSEMFDGMNKKTLIVGGAVVVGLIVVVVIASAVVNAITPKFLSYTEFEDKLSKATKKYYENNPTLLPTVDGETTLYYDSLVEGGYIKPVNEILENGDSCTAQSIVAKYGDYYSYIPYLNCPGDYESKELYKVVKENNKTTTEGVGLYRGPDSFYFRGEIKSNYVKIGNALWRIVKINNDNSMTIIQAETYKEYEAWDNRYNIDEKSKYGVNDFELSRVKDTLKELAAGELVFTDTEKAKLVGRKLCVGKRALVDTDTSNSVECLVMSEDSYIIGLITAADFMSASLDENCTSAETRSCINYNFLATYANTSWTITANSDDTRSVFYYDKNGLKPQSANIRQKMNLTAFLSKRAFYKSGTGTLTDPYEIR